MHLQVLKNCLSLGWTCFFIILFDVKIKDVSIWSIDFWRGLVVLVVTDESCSTPLV